MSATQNIKTPTYRTDFIGSLKEQAIDANFRETVDGERKLKDEKAIDELTICSEEIVAASETPGWKNIIAVEMIHRGFQTELPPADRHSILLLLNFSAETNVEISGRETENPARAGEITIIPAAGVPTAQNTREIRALHLCLEPAFARKIAEGGGEKGGMSPFKLRKALGFVEENLENEREFSLGKIADKVGISYFHFSRSFKQSTGVSPNKYIVARRIERAKKLLAQTDSAIADIALRVGFSSQSHFTTMFQRLTGTTPNNFRRTL